MGYGTSKRIRPAGAVILTLGLGLLAGCETGMDVPFLKSGDRPAEAASAAGSTSTRLVERDVEAPEVFQVTEAGLWDGRPSLGGVWVAHPDVKEPERVIIRNTTNGKFVIGALFRREREIPGPRIQVSSDAAAALGMLAGAPVRLNVTALRREKVEETAPPPASDTDKEANKEANKGRAEQDAKADDRARTPRSGDIDAAPLDPIAGAAAAAIAATAPKKRPETGAANPSGGAKRASPAPAPAPAKTAAETASPKKPAKKPAAPARKASSLEKPYIQIGIFNVEANAMRTAAMMRSVGIIPTIYEQTSKGKPFWRVVVGPARTKSERSALMKQVRKAGFSDAYYVTN